MLLVVRRLKLAATVGFVDGRAHLIGDGVAIHDDEGVDVAGGSPHRLDEARFAAQEARFVRIDDADQRHLGQIQPLAQQIDAHQDVELALAQLSKDRYPLQGVDLAVQVAHPQAAIVKVGGEVLGQSLRKHRNENALALLGPRRTLLDKVGDLALGRLHVDLRIQQSRRPDDLLDHLAATFLQLVWTGRSRDENYLRYERFELVKTERPIIQRAGKAKPVIDQRLLAAAVAGEHRAELRHRHVRLVNKDKPIIRIALGDVVEIVQECVGLRAGSATIQVAGIVLDARAVADLLDHLQVVFRAGKETLCF